MRLHLQVRHQGVHRSSASARSAECGGRCLMHQAQAQQPTDTLYLGNLDARVTRRLVYELCCQACPPMHAQNNALLVHYGKSEGVHSYLLHFVPLSRLSTGNQCFYSKRCRVCAGRAGGAHICARGGARRAQGLRVLPVRGPGAPQPLSTAYACLLSRSAPSIACSRDTCSSPFVRSWIAALAALRA